MTTKILMVLVCVLSLTSVVFSQNTASTITFSSLNEAYGVLVNSVDVKERNAAYEIMLSACGEISDTFTFQWLVPRLVSSAKGLNRASDAEAALLKRMSKESAPTILHVCVQGFMYLYIPDNDVDKAVKLLVEHINKDNKYTSSQIATMADTAVLELSKLLRYVEISEIYAKTAKVLSNKDDLETYIYFLNNYALFLYSQMKDGVCAEKLLLEILAYEDKCLFKPYCAAAELLYAIEKARGNNDKAIDAIMLILARPSVPPQKIVNKLLAVGVPSETLEKTVTILREWISSSPDDNAEEFQSRLVRLQPEIVEALIALKKYEEAIKECRVFVFNVNNDNYASAVELTARTLKIFDGNISRVNEFLAFQRSDEKPAPNSKNILLNFAALNDPVRHSVYENVSKSIPTTWGEWLNRSSILLWLDRPEESINAALEAFKISPFNDASLQRCVSSAVKPILVATRDLDFAQSVVIFMFYGKVGPDGISGTSDDLTDPFPEVFKKLRYSESRQ